MKVKVEFIIETADFGKEEFRKEIEALIKDIDEDTELLDFKTLGETLRKRKLELGLNHREMAKRTGYHPTWIVRVERDSSKFRPSSKGLERLRVGYEMDDGKLGDVLDPVAKSRTRRKTKIASNANGSLRGMIRIAREQLTKIDQELVALDEMIS